MAIESGILILNGLIYDGRGSLKSNVFSATAPSGGPRTAFGSEMDSQSDDEAKIIRLGLNAVRTDLGVRDAIPDARNIEREAFVEVERQRAFGMVSGLADLTASVLAAVLQEPLDARSDGPFEAAAKRKRGRSFLRRVSRLGGLKPGILIGRAGGDIPLNIFGTRRVTNGVLQIFIVPWACCSSKTIFQLS